MTPSALLLPTTARTPNCCCTKPCAAFWQMCIRDRSICGALGGLLGLAAMYINVPDFPAADPLTALAVGIVSGLAATGADQVIKQIGKDN